jgi:hypothetical protein
MRSTCSILLILCIGCPIAFSAPPESVNLRRTVVVDVVERTKDAVVYVSTTKLISERFGPFGDPFWAVGSSSIPTDTW